MITKKWIALQRVAQLVKMVCVFIAESPKTLSLSVKVAVPTGKYSKLFTGIVINQNSETTGSEVLAGF